MKVGGLSWGVATRGLCISDGYIRLILPGTEPYSALIGAISQYLFNYYLIINYFPCISRTLFVYRQQRLHTDLVPTTAHPHSAAFLPDCDFPLCLLDVISSNTRNNRRFFVPTFPS